MADNSELEFRKFTLEDTESLRDTYKLCFDTDVDDRYFQWKYVDNPAGEVVAFVAVDGKTIAAFYGVLPETYMVNGKPKKIYQSMDTMTHPNYQRRGLFGKLANMTYDYVAETVGELKVVGIAGSSSYPGFVKKLKWKDINQFKYFFTNKLLFKTFNLFRKNKKLEFKKVTELNQELTNFFSTRKISSKPIQPFVSAEFFEWRVFKNPLKDFKVVQIIDGGKTVGVCVYTLPEANRCFINFLSFTDESLFDAYAGTVIDYLFKENPASFIYTWEPTNSALHKALGKIGFVKNSFDKGLFSYRVPLIIRAEPEDSDGTSWFEINNFDLQPLMQD
jgi:hypothetical protein